MRLSSVIFAAAALASSAYAGLEDCKVSAKLTGSNFDSAIAGKNALVAFFAPWCGHCKSLAPTWEKLAQDFADEEKVLIGHLDADNADNKPTSDRYGVRGYPTIKYFPADGSEPIEYQSGRTEEAFLDWINERAGTHRTSGGLLNELAGRLPDFDALLNSFLSSSVDARTGIVDQAKALAGSLNLPTESTAAAYYLKVMEKLSTSTDWAQTELARLQKLASKRGAMAGKSLDDLQIRQNILSAFNAAKASANSMVSEAGASASSVIANAGGAASSASVVVEQAASSVASQASAQASTASQQAGSAAREAYATARGAVVDASKSAESAASAASSSLESAYTAASTGVQKVVGEL